LVNTNQNEVSVLIVEEQELVMGFAVHTVANTEWLDIERMVPSDNQIPAAMRSFVKGIYTAAGADKPELRLLDRVAILRSSQWNI
jgi:purine-binding chemotaxis protein CheW